MSMRKGRGVGKGGVVAWPEAYNNSTMRWPWKGSGFRVHLRMGALKGVILDADGSELVDLFDAFEITQQSVAFDLGTTGTNVKAKCGTVLSTIEDNLKGEFMTDWQLILAFITLTIMPTIIVFFLAQRHIIAGLTAGAVKS